MEVKITTISKDEIKAPKTLYKYRSWDKPLHRTLLSLQTIYMAAPSSFEDEKEFKNFKQYEQLSDQQIIEKYILHSHYRNPTFTEEEHLAHANSMLVNTPLRDAEALEHHREQFYNKYNERLGVLSLTDCNSSINMWNYYSGSGKGFCVGLKTDELFNFVGSGGAVLYPDDGLPMINATDSFDEEIVKQTYFKEKIWEFEQEYRTTIFSPYGLSESARKIRLPKHCLVEVILGWNMSLSERKRLIKVCKNAKLEVTILQANRVNGEVILSSPEDI